MREVEELDEETDKNVIFLSAINQVKDESSWKRSAKLDVSLIIVQHAREARFVLSTRASDYVMQGSDRGDCRGSQR